MDESFFFYKPISTQPMYTKSSLTIQQQQKKASFHHNITFRRVTRKMATHCYL